MVTMLGASRADALVLFDGLFAEGVIGGVGTNPNVIFTASYLGIADTTIFGGETFDITDPTNVGRMFTVSAGDAGFTEFSSNITNGVIQGVLVDFAFGGGSAQSVFLESSYFGSSSFSLNSYDYAGYAIDSYKVTIDSITQSPTNADFYEFSSSLIVNGERITNVVPEPSTMLLFGVGMLGVSWRRMNRH